MSGSRLLMLLSLRLIDVRDVLFCPAFMSTAITVLFTGSNISLFALPVLISMTSFYCINTGAGTLCSLFVLKMSTR